MKSRDGVSLKHDWVIVSYDMLRNDSILDAVMERHWDHVIMDEAHYLKDPSGNKRTRVLCAPDLVPSVAGRITMLSGTLMPNQPIECYNPIRLLDWDAIDRMSLDSFRNHYYGEGFGFVRVTRVVNGAKVSEVKASNRVRNQPRNLDDLQQRLRSRLMVRRLKKDVLTQLPAKRWHFVPLQANSAVRQALSHPGWGTVERLYDADPDDFERHIPIDGQIATARRELGEAKAPLIASYVRELLQSGVRKVIVGAWHTSVLALLADDFSHAGIKICSLVKGLSPARLQQAVDQFQTDEETRICLGQLKIMGLGHTLTEAQDGVLAEPDWTPGNNDQFLDRLHRRGQRGSVLGHIPIVPGTLEERIVGSAIEKDVSIYAAMDKRH